jgi:MraZ protein
VEENPNPTVVEPPRGFHQARVDEKGRCKLPAVVQAYFGAQGVKKVFITTLDLHTVRLYPIPVWEQNEKLFEKPGEEAENAEKVYFLARHFGADSDLDNQGRVLLPQELRRELGIENQPVWLGYDKGAIEMYGETIYQAKLAEAKAEIAGAILAMKKKGLK